MPETTKALVPDLSSFGARLAAIRQARGWNEKEAARICGVPSETWRRWEDGKLPRDYIDACHKIAKGAGIDLDWLVMGPGDDVTSWLLPPAYALAG